MPIEGLARSHSPFLFLNHRRPSPSCAEPGTGCHHFLGTRGYFGRRSERRGEGRRGCGAAPGLESPPMSPSRSLLLLALGCQMLQPGSAQLSLEELRRRFRWGLYIGRASWLGFTHCRCSRKLPGKDFSATSPPAPSAPSSCVLQVPISSVATPRLLPSSCACRNCFFPSFPRNADLLRPRGSRSASPPHRPGDPGCAVLERSARRGG